MNGDYEVGYARPPKAHQFRKGMSGNPRGRRPKKAEPVDHSLAATLKRVSERQIELRGQSYTMLELELIALQAKASKGDVAASRHLSRLRAEAGLLKPAEEFRGGVLAVPMAVDTETWELLTALQQAKHRTSGPVEIPGIVHDPNTTEHYLAYDALKRD